MKDTKAIKQTKQTKTKKAEDQNQNNELNLEELLSMPVTVAPSGLNLYVMQLNAVTRGNTKIVAQGAEWLRIDN